MSNEILPTPLYTTSRAYSLVEILMVIGLSMVLFVAGLSAAVGSSSQLQYLNTSNKVVAMVRQARSLAISGASQLDYTDFDQDSLNHLTASEKGGPDRVTPAHYGIYFFRAPDEQSPDEVILFADNHGVPGEGKEGLYDPALNQVPERFAMGYDIIVERFTLPKNIRLAFLKSDANFILYSPIFADVMFGASFSDSEFLFGLEQQSASLPRKRCFVLHRISGVPESTPCP